MYIYIYIFTHKVHICKRITLTVKCKIQPKFSQIFLIFEHYNKNTALIFIFVSIEEKPLFSHSSMNNTGPFFQQRRQRFYTFSYIGYTIFSVIFYFYVILCCNKYFCMVEFLKIIYFLNFYTIFKGYFPFAVITKYQLYFPVV